MDDAARAERRLQRRRSHVDESLDVGSQARPRLPRSNPLLISPDGETCTEAAGPDGEPGADPAVWLAGSASVGDATVVPGQDAGIETAGLVEGELA